jgi:hypothetical protein
MASSAEGSLACLLDPQAIIYRYRGKEKRVQRSIKDLAAQELPFANLARYAAFKLTMLLAFKPDEMLREDSCPPATPISFEPPLSAV